MVNLEGYHVMSESEILQKLHRENPSRNISTSDHAMMAWENLEEPINENKNDTEDNCSLEEEEYKQRNLEEDKEADDEFSETSSSTDSDHLELDRI